MRKSFTIPKNSTERVKRYNFRYRQNRKHTAMLWGWTHHLTKVKLFKKQTKHYGSNDMHTEI